MLTALLISFLNQERGDQFRRFDGDVLLSFVGRRSQMRCTEHLLQLGKAIIRLDWFTGKDVDRRSRDMARLDGIGESVLIDDAAASTVHQPHTLLHRCETGRVDHAQRFRSRRGVDGQEVALRDHLVDVAIELDSQLSSPLSGEEWVVAQDLHLQSQSPLGDRQTDPSEADDRDGLAGQLDSGVALAVPLPFANRLGGWADMPSHRHQHRDRELGGAGRVSRRGVHDDDPLPRRRSQIDRVDADTRSYDHLQPGLAFESRCGKLRRAADDDPIGIGEFRPQFFERADGLIDDLDPGRLLENLESGLGEIVSDQNA